MSPNVTGGGGLKSSKKVSLIISLVPYAKNEDFFNWIFFQLEDDDSYNLLFNWRGKPTGDYRWTSLYARDRDSKNRLAYIEFTYKKTKDYCKSEAGS